MSQATPKFQPEKYDWLRNQLEIDFLNLDEQQSRIPVLVQEASEHAAMAAEARDAEKDELIRTTALIADRMRKEPLPAGTKEKSETRISSEILLDPDYQAQVTRSAEARLDAALWGTMLEGLRTKSSSLRAAADLISAGFITQSFVLEKRRVAIRDQSKYALPEPTVLPALPTRS